MCICSVHSLAHSGRFREIAVQKVRLGTKSAKETTAPAVATENMENLKTWVRPEIVGELVSSRWSRKANISESDEFFSTR